MSSLWTDMLHLHGYINDLAFMRRQMDAPTPPKPNPSKKQKSHSPRSMLSTWSARLCQGIGDGALHTQ